MAWLQMLRQASDVDRTPSFESSPNELSEKHADAAMIHYGDGTAAFGQIYEDNLTIGEAALFYSLINAGVLDEQAFTFKLRKEGSSLTLGSKSPSATYVPVTDASYWTVNTKVNGASKPAIIDSGTTVIVAPVDDANALFSQLNLTSYEQDSEWLATFDCKSPPAVSFSFGAKTITLKDTVTYGTTSNGSCIFSVIGANLGLSAWTLGDSLFQETVVSFDVENQQVGFD